MNKLYAYENQNMPYSENFWFFMKNNERFWCHTFPIEKSKLSESFFTNSIFILIYE